MLDHAMHTQVDAPSVPSAVILQYLVFVILCRASKLMSNHVIHVMKEFRSDHGIHGIRVIWGKSCQIMSFMSRAIHVVIHVQWSSNVS
jgi:hypothetical protein